MKDFIPAKEVNAFVLDEPSVDATNERKLNNVRPTHKEFKVEISSFQFTFETNSMTAIEIEKKVK